MGKRGRPRIGDEKMPTVAFAIDEEQLAMVRQYAKDMGYPSTSSAIRRIIQEWAQFKAQQLPLPMSQS